MLSLFEHLDSVERLLTLSPLGLMSDIDGTISVPAPNPDNAQVSPKCRRSLDFLSKHLALVAAISGRPVYQMRKMLELEGIVYVGNHGFERWVGGDIELYEGARHYLDLIESAIKELQPLLEDDGIFFENKGTTASIHYRLSQDLLAARKQILDVLENSPAVKGLMVKPGRVAVDILPPLEVNKGSAVRALINEYHLRAAIYLGDDLSDIDAFRALHESRSPDFSGICVGVIDKDTFSDVEKEADYTLNGVNEVERFLEWLTTATQS